MRNNVSYARRTPPHISDSNLKKPAFCYRLKPLALVIAGTMAAITSFESNAANQNFISTASSAKFIKIVEDTENGGYILQNKIEGTQSHTYVNDEGIVVGDIDINFNPAEEVKAGNTMFLGAQPKQTPEGELLGLIKLNFKTDARFDAQNEASSYPTIDVSYGRAVELSMEQGKTLTVNVRPGRNSFSGIRATDEGKLTFSGGILQVNAIGDYRFDTDQSVLEINSNSIVAGGGSRWDSGGININNEAVVIESQLQTASDFIRAIKFNGGLASINTSDFKIVNAQTGQRFTMGVNTMGGNHTELVADNVFIDADVAISTQDEGTNLTVSGQSLNLLGRVEAYDGAVVTFARNENFADSLVSVVTTQADAVVGMPTDAPTFLTDSPVITFETDTFISAEGSSTEGESDYRIYRPGNTQYAAVRANRLSVINLNNEQSAYQIYGNLIAGRGQVTDQQGGQINVGGAKTQIVGDVLAGNTGEINLTLKNGSVFEGRVDDYQDAGKLDVDGNAMVFRPEEFAIDVTESGAVNMTIADSTWTARQRNFVSKIEFAGADASKNLIDMSRDANSSLTVQKLSGSGTIKMRISDEVGADGSRQTDMLYVGELAEDAQIHIDLDASAFDSYEDLEGIRFATTTGDYFSEGSATTFSARLQDQGFFNRNLEIHTEQYVSDDADNTSYNGSADGSVEGESGGKPGQTYVDSVFGSNTSTNWYIGAVKEDEGGDTGEEPGGDTNPPAGPTISDAGQAIIATARGLYYNAIEIDRFNQRYGDRRYDENNKSLWARVRHDRWGTDAGVGNFKSQNTTYQVGFDYTKPNEDGKMIYGIAVDLMDGNADYESIDGSGETKRYAVSAYATYMGDNGSYLDVVGKVGRLSNEYSVRLDSGAGVSADYMNWMAGISVEAGHQLTSEGSRWFAEPQIQAQYVFVSDNDYSNGQTKIKQDNIHSFITRAGFRAGRWLGEGKNANVYFKTDVLHEWAGDQDIHVSDKTTSRGGETFSINNHGTWFDVGFGFQAPMGKSFYAYGDAEYRFGNDLYQTWTFNLGGKYVF